MLRLTDGNLGRHMEVLAGDGLIRITKWYDSRRPRTRAEITKPAEQALGWTPGR
ncbi:MAG: transcriptional regulator [Actinomycetota bacterium]|nr:transcriptional regulator [Actinomycetota bacterium]